MVNLTKPGGDSGEGHITILPWKGFTVVQGTWAIGINTAYILCGDVNNDAADANLDEITFQVYLAKGVYSLESTTPTIDSAGIIKFSIDGTLSATHDLYSAGAASNVLQRTTGIAITKSGIKTLSMKVDGKNGASSGYRCFVQSITLWRTA